MRVTNGISLGWSPLLLVGTVNSVQTLKAILWGKSPGLVIFVYATNVLQQLVLQKWRSGITALNAATGLDKPIGDPTPTANGRTTYWNLEQAIRNFEDMRINAKELDILTNLARTDTEQTHQNKRMGFVREMYGALFRQKFRIEDDIVPTHVRWK
jgi:hypothetical protein